VDDDGGLRIYVARSTSRRTAEFEPVEIVLRENPDGSQRRLVVKVSQLTDPPTAGATLRATFVYQHRRKADADWSEDNFNLATLRAGQEVRLELHSAETLHMFEELGRLYAATGVGVRYGSYAVAVADPDQAFAVVPAEVADHIRGLSEREGAGVFEVMARLRPDWATWSALVEEHRQRAADLAEFEAHLNEEPTTWDERDWQSFFRRAPWIFGHGLDYTFLVDEATEVDFGGQDFGGRGGERGDELLRTAGQFRFAVLVELKRPDTELISGPRPYRNGAWRIGRELAGGVAQLQANCERIRKAADERPNVRWLDEHDMTVADPQAILLIGHTRQLGDDAQRTSFHRFRRNLWNPTVLTYDELFERARFLVDKAASRAEDATPDDLADRGRLATTEGAPEPTVDESDDLPF
jgi:hypothetical protein